MTTNTDIKTLAERLSTVRSVDDVEWLLDAAELLYGPITTAPVGDRPNNSGIIRVSSDPMLALVERITNAIDAVLELLAKQHGGTAYGPREAAQQWLKLPAAGLSAMSDAERRALAQNIRVVMEESGQAKRPTISITDMGVGLHPDDFENTILSLNASNKVQAPYTMGTFGQGGSATLGFSRFTVMISRCHASQLNGRSDLIGWTIATELFDETTMKVPSYVFYRPVGGSGVFELDPGLMPELEYGTRVIHVAYDAQRGATAWTTGAWQIFNATLFDPVLPFILGGNRKGVDPEWTPERMPTRVITGTATRLSNQDVGGSQIELAHKDSHLIDLGNDYSSVRVAYWALRRPEGSASSSEITRSYVEPSAAVSMTLFGQRQDATPRTWIKDQVKLPFLYKNLVVQIDADRLTPRAKRELFASTRERATESDLRRRIYDEVADILRGDGMLAYLNNLEKDRLLKKSSEASNDKVRKRLAKFVKTKLKNVQRQGLGGSGNGGEGQQKSKGGPPTPPRDLSDDHLPKVPTSLAFQRPSVTVRQGRKTSVWVDINAKNGYLPAHDDDLTITWPGGSDEEKLRVATRSTLGGGLSSWRVAAEPDATLGDYQMHVELVTANGLLQADLKVAVAPPPPAPKEKPSTEPETGPEVRWVSKPEWGDHDFTERSVGRVLEDTTSTTIFVNREYRLLVQALSGKMLTAEAIDMRADRYQYPVACALWLQNHEVQDLDASARPSEDYLNTELERLAEAVLLAADPDVMLADAESSE
jgi:hypothetical protein